MEIGFGFDQDVTLSVESQFTYTSVSETVDWHPGEIQSAAKAVKLLGHRVAKVEATNEGDLRLFFSTGDVLRITRTNNGFESYQVTARGATIVV